MGDTSLETTIVNGSHNAITRGRIREITKLLGRLRMYMRCRSSMMCFMSVHDHATQSSNCPFPTKHASIFQAYVNCVAQSNQTCIQTNTHDSIHALKTQECIKLSRHLRNTCTHGIDFININFAWSFIHEIDQSTLKS